MPLNFANQNQPLQVKTFTLAMAELDSLRRSYKHLISKGFESLLQTQFIQTCIRRLSFDNYRFSIAHQNELEAILELIIECYSKHNGWFILFGWNKAFKVYWKEALEYIIQGGRCLIATDTKSNQIVATFCLDDFCDDYTDKLRFEDIVFEVPLSQHSLEIAQQTFVSEETNNRLQQLSNNKYGKIFVGHFQAKKQNINAPYLSFFLSFVIGANLMCHYCGYEYMFAQWSHLSNIRMAKSIGANHKNIMDETDYSDYIFEDGSSIDRYFEHLGDRNKVREVKRNCKIQDIIFNKENINNAIRLVIKHIANNAHGHDYVISKL